MLIKDKHGNIIDEIDTRKYLDNDFSIIVTQKSFGQIQSDLTYMLNLNEGSRYPWAIKYDDLEVFLLTLKAMHKKPQYLINYLINREFLHGHVISSDELQICGGYLLGKITANICNAKSFVCCNPNFSLVFDKQYRKGMGFKNERYWKEKHDNTTLLI